MRQGWRASIIQVETVKELRSKRGLKTRAQQSNLAIGSSSSSNSFASIEGGRVVLTAGAIGGPGFSQRTVKCFAGDAGFVEVARGTRGTACRYGG